MKNRNNRVKIWLNNDTGDLFKTILKLRNATECLNFFRDLLTEKEIITFAMRWKAAKMLYSGFTYEEIEKETGMSSTTIARINRWLEYGEGGYKLMLKRAQHSH
jgi:TrpR-related protein YerC/YecD